MDKKKFNLIFLVCFLLAFYQKTECLILSDDWVRYLKVV